MADREVEMLRGRQARDLLQNDLLVEVLNTMESKFQDAWKNSALSQSDVREESYRMLKACELFRRQLTHIVETGKMAAITESDRQDRENLERRLAGWDGSADTAPRGKH